MLVLARRVVVDIVEARLAYPDDLRMLGQPHDLRRIDIDLLVGVVRVRAHGARDRLIRLRDGPHAVELPYPCPNGNHMANTGALRPIQDVRQVLPQPVVVEVAMTIDQHQAAPASGSA